ncbi:MAG: ATP-binding protein [Bacteroidota bacterium]
MANRRQYKISGSEGEVKSNFSVEQKEYIETLENTVNYLKNEIDRIKSDTNNVEVYQKYNYFQNLINSAIDISLSTSDKEFADKTHKLFVQNASAIESNFYFYNKNSELKPISISETSAFLDNYINHLEEQGILDWIFEQNCLKVIPNLDETAIKQNSIFIFPIARNEKRFGVFLASTILHHDAIEDELLSVFQYTLLIISTALLNLILLKQIEDISNKFNVLNHQLLNTSILMSVGEISGVVAREMDSPINIIQANVDLITRSIGNIERRAEIIQTNIKRIEYLNSFIKNLINTGESKEIINLQELIKETISILQYQIENKDVKIIASFDNDNIFCECYRNQIQHVLLNILLNARDAMPNGGSITIGCFKQSDKKVSISIADTGEGISEEDFQNIFEPHFTNKSGSEKLAINLYISKLIIDNHKGRISFASELGKGTTFKIVLPIARTE